MELREELRLGCMHRFRSPVALNTSRKVQGRFPLLSSYWCMTISRHLVGMRKHDKLGRTFIYTNVQILTANLAVALEVIILVDRQIS